MGSVSLSKFVMLILVPVLVLGASIGVAYYYYTKYEHSQLLLNNPQEATKMEAKSLIQDVSKYMELPAAEQPTLATVTDASKLQDQPFFKKAKNGDKVLIYIQAKQAILYRPATKKIIAVAPISINNDKSQESVAGATAEPSPSVEPSVKPSPTTFRAIPTFTPSPSPTVSQ